MKMLFGMLLLSGLAFAEGQGGGNGGDVIVCPNEVVLLDYLEMKKRQMDLNLPGQTKREKIETVVSRIQRLDPNRARIVSGYALEILTDIEKHERGETELKNVSFTTDVLSDVPDSLELSIPAGCTKHQLVTQAAPIYEEDKRYNIASNYWNLMDENQKTLTVLHEAWYRSQIDENAQDSRFARFLNGYFVSSKSLKDNFSDYLKRLEFSAKFTQLAHFRLAYPGTEGKIVRKYAEDEEFVMMSAISKSIPTQQLPGFEQTKPLDLLSAKISQEGKFQELKAGGYLGRGRSWKAKIQNIEVANTSSFTDRFTVLTLDGDYKIKKMETVANQLVVDGVVVRKSKKEFAVIIKIENGVTSYEIKQY